jgi:hypothetical protein
LNADHKNHPTSSLMPSVGYVEAADFANKPNKQHHNIGWLSGACCFLSRCDGEREPCDELQHGLFAIISRVVENREAVAAGGTQQSTGLACCEGEERDNNFTRTPKHNNQC